MTGTMLMSAPRWQHWAAQGPGFGVLSLSVSSPPLSQSSPCTMNTWDYLSWHWIYNYWTGDNVQDASGMRAVIVMCSLFSSYHDLIWWGPVPINVSGVKMPIPALLLFYVQCATVPSGKTQRSWFAVWLAVSPFRITKGWKILGVPKN